MSMLTLFVLPNEPGQAVLKNNVRFSLKKNSVSPRLLFFPLILFSGDMEGLGDTLSWIGQSVSKVPT